MQDKGKDRWGLRGFRIRSPYDIRRALARCINEVYKGQITPDIAAKVGYLSGMWLKAYDQADLLERIKKLEQQMASGEKEE